MWETQGASGLGMLTLHWGGQGPPSHLQWPRTSESGKAAHVRTERTLAVTQDSSRLHDSKAQRPSPDPAEAQSGFRRGTDLACFKDCSSARS